ncbi:MAG: hypothetical protein ACI8QF_004772, partial [Limisphaerales bacterium]
RRFSIILHRDNFEFVRQQSLFNQLDLVAGRIEFNGAKTPAPAVCLDIHALGLIRRTPRIKIIHAIRASTNLFALKLVLISARIEKS